MGSKTNVKSMITNFQIFEKNESIPHLYHGSRHLFNKFNQNELGKDNHLLSYLGYHFTPNKDVANKFAKKPDKVIYEVEITVNKTLKINEGDLVRNMLKWGDETGLLNIKTEELDELLKLPYHTISMNEDSIVDEMLDNNIVENKTLSFYYKSYLKMEGYDSIEYLNEIEYYGDKPDRYDWIVFDSNQIKIIDIIKY